MPVDGAIPCNRGFGIERIGTPVRTIAIIDPYWTGHHATYVKLFSKTLLALGHRVMAFCPNPPEVEDWLAANCTYDRTRFQGFELHDPVLPRFPYEPVQRALTGLGMWRSSARALKCAFRETGVHPDMVFFLWLDNYLGYYRNRHVVNLLFPHNWTGLYFQPRHLRHYEHLSDVQGTPTDHDVELLSSRCRGVALLDEGVADLLRARLANKPVVVFPDVADASCPDHDYPLLADIVNKARGRRIISIIGGLARRKGMFTLLEAAAQMQQDDGFFLFAGVPSLTAEEETILSKIVAESPENCFFHFGFIPGEAQFNALVELSDVLYAAYENFPHSSNLLTKAALFEKPVIVSTGNCMGERVAALRIGESIPEGNVAECIAAIRRILTAHDAKWDFAGFRKLHSEERLSAAVEEILAISSE